jgi:hypothetical protein
MACPSSGNSFLNEGGKFAAAISLRKKAPAEVSAG